MEPVNESLDAANFLASTSLLDFGIRFLVNFVAIFIIVRLIYYPAHKNKDFLFTFFLFNVINFMICILLSTAKLKMGFAFGLFAIFSILRYRTVTVPVREMGYFFISVTIGIINALALGDNYFIQLIIANTIIIAFAYFLDYRVTLKHENFKEIVYERIDLIQPEKREEMLEDLRKRTGLNIHRVEFIKIDFLKDIARIYAFYLADQNESKGVMSEGDDD
jgi:hypothetical protein